MTRLRPAIHRLALAVCLVLAAGLAAVSAPARESSPGVWVGASRIVAVGDIHGAYDTLVLLLRRAGLVDESLNWTGRDAHLVIMGDVVDRGPADRKALDLLRRLADEAAAAGGRVHQLLGNHEVMNLVRDFRYVGDAGFAAFAAEEDPADRARAFEAFRANRAKNGNGNGNGAGNGNGNHGGNAAANGAANHGVNGNGTAGGGAAGNHGGNGTGTAAGNHGGNGVLENGALDQSLFDTLYPPGYFGRLRAFGPGGAYAEWLLGRPTAVMIDGYVFVHGGLSEDLAEGGIDAVNAAVRQEVRDIWRLRDVFERAPGAFPFLNFEELQRAGIAVQRHGASGPMAEDLDRAALELSKVLQGPAFATDGPLWYRAQSMDNETLEWDALGERLAALGAKVVVVGHSPTRSRALSVRFNGRLIRTDVGLYSTHAPVELLIDSDGPRELDGLSGQTAALRGEPPQGERGSSGMAELADAQMEQFLELAEIASSRPLGAGGSRPRLLELSRDRLRLRAVLKTVDETAPGRGGGPTPSPRRPNRHQHEVAAYRLDRMLDLRMIPVAVLRRVDDRWGSVQAWVEAAVNQRAMSLYHLAPRDQAEVERQLRRGKIFDALIGLEQRDDSDVLVLLNDSRVFLVDQAQAFAPDADAAAILGDGPCALDEPLRAALKRLGRGQLRAQLEPLLSKEQIDAVLKRRDAILAKCGPATPP